MSCCFKVRAVEKERNIDVGAANHGFCSNEIISSKYSLLNPFSYRFILWKNLFEQFQKTANIYFLVMSCIMQVPGISPFGRWTTASTLAFVVIVSLCKALYEDIQRHKDDHSKNSALVQTLDNGEWKMTKWIDIHVGDVVRLKQPTDKEEGARNGVPIPCDMLLIGTSSGTHGVSYVETMDLDGETNLKPKAVFSLDDVKGLPQTEDEDVTKSYFTKASHCEESVLQNATITCDPPNPDLSKLWGSVSIGGKQIAVSQNNVLFRGARMCKTPDVVGVVLYTGHETKLGKNMSSPPTKVSRMERLTNRRLLIILLLQILMCITSAIGFAEWTKDNEEAFYADYPSGSAGDAAVSFFTFFILYSNLIPISLYVSMEITKFLQGRLMTQDLAMYDEHKDLPANIRTTDINDEIGQVSHVFSDKTGTLTQNVMQIFKIYCDGTLFGKGSTSIAKAAASRSGQTLQDPRPHEVIESMTWPFWDARIQHYDPQDPKAGAKVTWNTPDSGLEASTPVELRKFFETLALCSTVLPGKGGARPNPILRGVSVGSLDAESPDELALIQAAAEFGVSLVQGDEDYQTIEVHRDAATPAEVQALQGGEEYVSLRYQTLAIVPFNSARKRMSFIARNVATNEIFVFTKGADSTMEPLLANRPEPWQEQSAIDRFVSGDTASLTAGISDTTEAAFRTQWMADNSFRTMDWYNDWEYEGRGEEGVVAIQEKSGLSRVQAEGLAGLYQTKWLADNARVGEQTGALADEGLRTLYIAQRRVSEEEWALWGEEWRRIKNLAIKQDEREKLLDVHSCRIEHGLNLVGVTAIEDKLQVRVPETIAALRAAGIKVWMITGDKKNTAVNIGHACSLLDETLDKSGPDGPHPIDLDGEGFEKEQILQRLDKAVIDAQQRRDRGIPYALILTSNSIKHIFAQPGEDDNGKGRSIDKDEGSPNVEKLFEIAVAAKSVIVARATPMQKAQVVDMIKSRDTWNVTLAIGDGANDVAMIQKAHVGVGIKGLEGGQAASQADFAVGQFRFLHRLLFVHGRWNYRRLALFSTYFFYKNAVLSFSLFFYNFLNGFSGQPLYDPWVIACFNVAWASWPIIVVAILDRDVVNTDNFHDFPLLYKMGRHNSDYTARRMLQWYVTAIYHATLCVFLPIINMMRNPIIDDEGRGYGLYHGGVLVYTNVVVVITLKLALHINSWTWIHHAVLWLCLLSWPAFLPLYAAIAPTFFGLYTMKGEFVDSITWAMFWIMLIGTTCACLGRDFLWRYMSYRVCPLLPPALLEKAVMDREREPGWKYVCTLRPISIFKVVQLLDAELRRPSSRLPVELIPGARRPYGRDFEDEHKRKKAESEEMSEEEDFDDLVRAGGTSTKKATTGAGSATATGTTPAPRLTSGSVAEPYLGGTQASTHTRESGAPSSVVEFRSPPKNRRSRTSQIEDERQSNARSNTVT